MQCRHCYADIITLNPVLRCLLFSGTMISQDMSPIFIMVNRNEILWNVILFVMIEREEEKEVCFSIKLLKMSQWNIE